MKRSAILATLMFMLASGMIFAQTSTRVGLGVMVSPNVFTIQLGDDANFLMPLHNTLVTIPIQFGKKFRIEPEIGILNFSRSTTSFDQTSRDYGFTNYRLGASLALLIPNAGGVKEMQAYIAARFATLLTSESSDYSDPNLTDTETSQSDLLLGLAFGSEYYFAKSFSIGGELQFNYYSYGDPDITPAPTSPSSTSDFSFININGMVTLRWFLTK